MSEASEPDEKKVRVDRRAVSDIRRASGRADAPSVSTASERSERAVFLVNEVNESSEELRSSGVFDRDFLEEGERSEPDEKKGRV